MRAYNSNDMCEFAVVFDQYPIKGWIKYTINVQSAPRALPEGQRFYSGPFAQRDQFAIDIHLIQFKYAA